MTWSLDHTVMSPNFSEIAKNLYHFFLISLWDSPWAGLTDLNLTSAPLIECRIYNTADAWYPYSPLIVRSNDMIFVSLFLYLLVFCWIFRAWIWFCHHWLPVGLTPHQMRDVLTHHPSCIPVTSLKLRQEHTCLVFSIKQKSCVRVTCR